MLCTYFNKKYIHNGLAWLRSVRRTLGPVPVIVLALDDNTSYFFKSLNDPALSILAHQELLDYAPGLSDVLAKRTQLSWAASYKPPLCKYILDKYGVVEYFDADCWFVSDLKPVSEEVKSTAVSIVPHRFSPTCPAFLSQFGVYNAGYVYFNKNNGQDAEKACEDWYDYCLNWKSVRSGETFWDQGVLNEWPEKYKAHIVQNPGANLAPWNQDQYTYSTKGENLLVNNLPVIWYHFHQHKVQCQEHVMAASRGVYKLHPVVVEKIYQPYEQELLNCLNMIAGYFKRPIEELY